MFGIIGTLTVIFFLNKLDIFLSIYYIFYSSNKLDVFSDFPIITLIKKIFDVANLIGI